MPSQPVCESAISLHAVSKHYGRLVAVKNLQLEVFKGEIFGFLGLNGAGKTTTIRILLDLLRPTTGTATVLGHDCQKRGLVVRSLVGYLPGELGLYGDMTGREILDVLARLSRQSVSAAHQQHLLDKMEFSTSDLRRKLREYSTGMKRKLGIIQTLQCDPPLLILDEPTEGLDPLMQESFYTLLFDLKLRGRTVFMSSHVLSEVERVCDRIGLLRNGEVVLLSSVEEVRKLAARRVRVIFDAEAQALPGNLPRGHEVLEVRPQYWDLRVEGPLGPLLSALEGLPVKDLMVEEPRLEDVLIRYYREGAP